MITKEDLNRIATLAKLNIEESEASEYIDEIETLLMHIDKIMIEDLKDTCDNSRQRDYRDLRDDAVMPSMSRDALLLNADDTQEGYVKLKRRV